jgi:hypothetical protein
MYLSRGARAVFGGIIGIGMLAALPALPLLAACSVDDVQCNMDRSAQDLGFNEGALEAAGILKLYCMAGGVGYGPYCGASQHALQSGYQTMAGYILSRPPVLKAARALLAINRDDAIKLALTTQSHDPLVRKALANNPQGVACWLAGGSC